MIKKILGAATVMPLAAAGMMAFSSAAEAAALTGTLNIAGTATFLNGALANPATDTITFSNAKVQAATTTGDFDAYDGLNAAISNISLSNPVGNVYQGTTTNPFIQIAPDLTFIADNPFSVNREFTTVPTIVGPFNFLLASTGLSGKFVNNSGQQIGAGVITANSFASNGSFSMTLTSKAESVPEPATLLGLGLVGASLAGMRRRKSADS